MKSRNSNDIILTVAESKELVTQEMREATEARAQSLTDEEIEALALEDIAEHGGPDPDGQVWVGLENLPLTTKSQLTLRVDDDVIAFFRGQGKGYQTRMNLVLRQYMEHIQNAEEKKQAS